MRTGTYIVLHFLAYLCAIFVLTLSPWPVQANSIPFTQWLQGVYQDAKQEGISQTTLDAAFAGFDGPIEKIIRLDRKQPEGTHTLAKYLDLVAPPSRIREGRKLLKEHSQLLEKIGKEYGVQPRFIVALWGIETSYGKNTGGFPVVHALATLAYDGRRSEFFRKEMMQALSILEANHIDAASMKGSWAGALGQCQFMPSSFHSYAVDYNGDGHKDIWTTLPDVFASIANYLNKTGWDDSMTWGRKVTLPKGFDLKMADKSIQKTLPEWEKLGVRRADGGALPSRPLKASLVLPDDHRDYAYLAYDNFQRILKWNRSSYFAVGVGTLSDALR